MAISGAIREAGDFTNFFWLKLFVTLNGSGEIKFDDANVQMGDPKVQIWIWWISIEQNPKVCRSGQKFDVLDVA